jgi:RING finger protein 113A
MFRKPKRSGKAALRNKRTAHCADDENDEHDQEEESTTQLIGEAKKATTKKLKRSSNADKEDSGDTSIMHQYQTSKTPQVSAAELATATAQYHPETKALSSDSKDQTEVGKGSDGIFRDKTRNKFLAGPLKASTFVRTTARFDYQPDICKDYKETGFCGFGDTCIYLHDRGDTLTGWQLEQQWEEEQKRKREQAQKEMDAFADGKFDERTSNNSLILPDDGLPFACHICREPFTNPVVTSCGHYFCEACIMDHVRNEETKGACPICKKDTHGVFNQPTKLMAKKRRLLSSSATWEDFANAAKAGKSEQDGEDT